MHADDSRRGVIFDIDGTLVDSNDAHAESWARTLAEFGYDVPAARVRPLIGMGGDKLLPALIGVDIESELGKQLAKRRGELFSRDYVPRLRAFPRARELAERLRSDGYILIVASSAGEDQLEKLIEISGIGDLLADTTSADDAERSKPDPDIVQAALASGALDPPDAVMIGDTVSNHLLGACRALIGGPASAAEARTCSAPSRPIDGMS